MNPTTRGKQFRNIPSTLYNKPDLARTSENLADVLDHIGFSEEHRKRRVKVVVMKQMFGSIAQAIVFSGELCELRMGSSIEGTTADGMGSDSDTLFFSTSIKAHIYKENTKQSFGVVFTRDKNTPAGYTKLQPVIQGCVINDALVKYLRYVLYLKINFEPDSKGRFMVAHFTDTSVTGVTDLKHGPADTIKDRGNQVDQDFVQSFLCNDITNEMQEWYRRDRIHNWPSKDTRDLFKTLGCFVVPVGHPSSPEKNIEWRVSFSLQERHLMWHLNPTQYHCFMLLKLIKTFLIKPQFGDVLTSYHCKTLLFYTIERHEQGIWIPENLIACLRMCLILLHEWISDKYIPNYFIPKENMFVKMDTALKGNYDKLKLYVADMRDNWQFLFQIGFNDLGNRFRHKQNGSTQVQSCIIDNVPVYIVDSIHIKRVFSSDCVVYTNQIQNTLKYLNVVQAVLQSTRNSTGYNTFEENITELYKQWFAGRTQIVDISPQLIESFLFCIENIESQPRLCAVMVWKSICQTSLGSVFAARYFQTGNEQYLLKSDTYLELEKSLNPMASMLLKATVLLKRSLLESNNVVLDEVECINKGREFWCFCYKNTISYDSLGERQPQNSNENVFSNTECIRFSCVCFKDCEFDIIPLPLTFEAYRCIGSSIGPISPYEKNWVGMVVVDPVMYLYYLQFLNNQHNNPGKAAVALKKLENTLFARLGCAHWPGHTDTWLNMLGDIFVKKGWTALALKCFKESYKLWPLHNAVRWHVMFLLLKFSESECNIPIIPDCRPCCCPHSCIVENVD